MKSKEITTAIDSPRFRSAYRESQQKLLRFTFRNSMVLGLSLYPAFSIIDWLTYPGQFYELLVIRIFVSISLLITLLWIPSIPDRLLVPAGVLASLITSNGIVAMTYFVGGASSPYYAGINLVFVFFAVAVPWTFKESLFSSSLTIIAYTVVSYIYTLQEGTEPGYWTAFSSNVAFLLGTATLCVYANIYQTKQRLENFRLNFELTDKNVFLNEALSELKQTQAKLIHSEKLNALGSLSAGLLHEINNPLNYSMTAVHLVKLEDLYASDPEFAETIDDIEDGMQRIHSIVGDLKAFAYPSEAAKQEQFSIHKAVESTLRFTGNERSGISTINEVPQDALVYGSHSHIVQVLINLLTNASKAVRAKGPAHTGEILIFAESREGRLWINVRDNGIGISDETLSRIFEPFFTTRVVGEGVGMGLSVCHTIIQNHGGTLTVDSVESEGATFSFDLEMKENQAKN